MFFFRINKVRIAKNRETVPFWASLWERDEAEVELWSFITADNMLLPDMSEFVATNDPRKRKEIVEEIASQVLSSRKIAPIENVRDNQTLTFGDTGYVLFQTETIPESFNWNFLAIELDEKERDNATRLREVISDPDFDRFTGNLVNAVMKAPNPGFQAVVSVGKFITSRILRDLENNTNDLIGVLYMSLNRREHYPHGERKKDNVGDLSNNMWVDYSLFGFEQKI
ncbi:MAG: hypothetical protein MUF49_13990 [Oculatellaceae cyanobacterium Prado106]|jgi:hypothetical protein|nr:hypothetical protein [Oculatellaceae cyanobacterium Prado106]